MFSWSPGIWRDSPTRSSHPAWPKGTRRLEIPPQAAEQQTKSTWRGLTDHISLLPHIPWKERLKKKIQVTKQQSHGSPKVRWWTSQGTKQWQHYVETKNPPKAAAHGQSTARQPPTGPCDHPTQQQGCSPRTLAQGLPLLGERENACAGFLLGIITPKPPLPHSFFHPPPPRQAGTRTFVVLLFFCTELDSRKEIRAGFGAANTSPGRSSHSTKAEVLSSGWVCLSSKPGWGEREREKKNVPKNEGKLIRLQTSRRNSPSLPATKQVLRYWTDDQGTQGAERA